VYVLLSPRLGTVTENVWEEVTDDEADSKPQPTKRAKEGSQYHHFTTHDKRLLTPCRRPPHSFAFAALPHV